MADPTKPAAPAGELITPQTQTPPESPAPPAEPKEKQQEPPKAVTLDELEEFGDKLVKRINQSSRDRDKAIKEEVGELRKRLEAAEIQLTPQQEAKLREEIAAKYDEEPEEPEEEDDSSGLTVEEAIRYMDAEIEDAFDLAGTTVTKSDPEFAIIQKALEDTWHENDIRKVKRIVTHVAFEQARAKAERLQKQNQSAAGRVVGGRTTPASGDTPVKSSRELWDHAYDKK